MFTSKKFLLSFALMALVAANGVSAADKFLSLIHISEPTRPY